MGRRKKVQDDLFVLKVKDFAISTRTINILTTAGYKDANDFNGVTMREIMALEGLGPILGVELKQFLKGAKIALKREERVKQEPKWPKETKEILIGLLGPRMNNYAENFRLCGIMINEFGIDCMKKFEIHPGITSLRYYFSGGQIAPWASEYAQKFMTWKLVEKEKEVVIDSKPEVEYTEEELNYKPIPAPPKTLADFLKSR